MTPRHGDAPHCSAEQRGLRLFRRHCAFVGARGGLRAEVLTDICSRSLTIRGSQPSSLDPQRAHNECRRPHIRCSVDRLQRPPFAARAASLSSLPRSGAQCVSDLNQRRLVFSVSQVSGAPEIPPAPAEPKPAPFLTGMACQLKGV